MQTAPNVEKENLRADYQQTKNEMMNMKFFNLKKNTLVLG
jgi:hypothetical protein